MQVALIGCTRDSKSTFPAATEFSTSPIATKPDLVSRYHEVLFQVHRHMLHTRLAKTGSYNEDKTLMSGCPPRSIEN